MAHNKGLGKERMNPEFNPPWDNFQQWDYFKVST